MESMKHEKAYSLIHSSTRKLASEMDEDLKRRSDHQKVPEDEVVNTAYSKSAQQALQPATMKFELNRGSISRTIGE